MFKVGDECYFIQTYKPIRGIITRKSGEFLVVKYGEGKGIRLRATKLFKTEEEAVEEAKKRMPPQPQRRHRNPYMYDQ